MIRQAADTMHINDGVAWWVGSPVKFPEGGGTLAVDLPAAVWAEEEAGRRWRLRVTESDVTWAGLGGWIGDHYVHGTAVLFCAAAGVAAGRIINSRQAH